MVIVETKLLDDTLWVEAFANHAEFAKAQPRLSIGRRGCHFTVYSWKKVATPEDQRPYDGLDAKPSFPFDWQLSDTHMLPVLAI